MYKISFYVPIEFKEKVKSAMFGAWAGRIWKYDNCCFEIEWTGQFRPLKLSKPTIWSQEKLEYVKEVKIEMVCEEKNFKNVMKALFESHPYEEVAYDYFRFDKINKSDL